MLQRLVTRVTLLRLFVITSGVVLGLGGLVLGSVVTGTIRDQSLEDAKGSLAQYVDGVLVNALVDGEEVRVARRLPAATRRELENRDDILSVKVWRDDGVLAWTSQEQDRIGRRFPREGHLAEALEGESEAELEDLGGEAEHAGEVRQGIDRALEIYVPLRGTGGDRVIGAYEVYSDASRLEATIADRVREIWIVIALVFLGVLAALGLLARGASRTLRTQSHALRDRSAALAESYAALERHTLEAVESLNATVEAKDPYTAGHSARVQRVALAIGRELGLPPDAMDALRWGGLFHDIGKIAIPDQILLKPDRLTAEEFDRMKEHSAEGARIVGKLGHLLPTVPVIRHHHERWDGRGYPDGLAGRAIPRLAAIVGLADAWDAMTTDRPYAAALAPPVALDELARGRGTQFAPDIVDAFVRVYLAETTLPGEDRELIPA